jgi:hypothetical protein
LYRESNRMTRRKVLELETVVNKDGVVRNRVPREKREPKTVEVATRNGPRHRRVKSPPNPLRKKNPENDLTPREEAFAATIVPRLLAGERGAISKTARELGYASAAHGSVLMQRPAVLRKIDENLNAALESVDAETSWLLERLAAIIDFDPRLLTENVKDLDDVTALALAGIDIEHTYEKVAGEREQTGQINKWKQYNKLDAIKMFLEFKKLLGTQRHELSGPNGQPLDLPAPILNIQFVAVKQQ